MRAPYHCGVLVSDLDAALDGYEAALGIAFREPDSRALRPLSRSGPAAATTEPVRFAFSVGGFPYVELIETQEAGLFDGAAGTGVHHVGAWVEEIDRVRAEQAAAGLGTVARFEDPDGVERVS